MDLFAESFLALGWHREHSAQRAGPSARGPTATRPAIPLERWKRGRPPGRAGQFPCGARLGGANMTPHILSAQAHVKAPEPERPEHKKLGVALRAEFDSSANGENSMVVAALANRRLGEDPPLAQASQGQRGFVHPQRGEWPGGSERAERIPADSHSSTL
jgi:hypothetical protein